MGDTRETRAAVFSLAVVVAYAAAGPVAGPVTSTFRGNGWTKGIKFPGQSETRVPYWYELMFQRKL